VLGLPGAALAETFSAGCFEGTGDANSLRAAIAQTNANGPGADSVTLGPRCRYLLTEVDNHWYGPNGLPPIAGDVTIEGNGSTIERDATKPPFRLLFVGADPASAETPGYISPGPGRLTLRDLTLTGGLAKGGDSNAGGGGAGMGGGIFSQGSVTLDRTLLIGNVAQGGAANDDTAGVGGGGIATDGSGGDFVPGGSGGGFGGAGPFGASGGAALFSGGGGGGTRAGETGGNASSGLAGVGGGPATGLGGSGDAFGGDASGGGAERGADNVTGRGAGGPGGSAGAGGASGAAGAFTGGAGTQGRGGGGGGGGGGGVGGGGGKGGVGGYGDASVGDGGGDGGNGGGGGFGAGGGRGGGRGEAGFSEGVTGHGGGGGFGGGGAAGGPLSSTQFATGGSPGFGGGTPSVDGGGGGAGMGGAIFSMQGSLLIRNSTLTLNVATGGADDVAEGGKGMGGAVFNLSGAFTAVGSTLISNSADFDGQSIYNLVYDGNTARTARTTLQNTIVAGILTPPLLVSDKTAFITPPPLGTAVADVGDFNLVGSSAARGTGTFSGTPLLTGDPQLGPLQDDGGLTRTRAPLAGSPVLDVGSPFSLTTDQRGLPRPSGSAADIGAVEVQVPAAPGGGSDVGPGPGSGSGSGPGATPPAFGASTKITLRLAASRVGARGPIPVTVSNTNAFAVPGKLSARTSTKVKPSRRGKAKLLSIKARNFSVAAGKKVTVRLSLTKSLRYALVRKGKLVLRVTVAVVDPAGNRRSVRTTLTPKLKRRR